MTGGRSKRVFDVVACAALVLLTAPVQLVIAAAILATSGRPVIFRQERVGLRGRAFMIRKFRTMVRDAGARGPNVSAVGDPRVTRVGRWLRSSHLDELPQLYNVLLGEMSLVGPRPETPEFVAQYDEAERGVLNVKPGIVAPSTIAFVDEAEVLASTEDPARLYVDWLMHERVRLDLEYVERVSIAHDLRLLVRQCVALIPGRRVPGTVPSDQLIPFETRPTEGRAGR